MQFVVVVSGGVSSLSASLSLSYTGRFVVCGGISSRGWLCCRRQRRRLVVVSVSSASLLPASCCQRRRKRLVVGIVVFVQLRPCRHRCRGLLAASVIVSGGEGVSLVEAAEEASCQRRWCRRLVVIDVSVLVQRQLFCCCCRILVVGVVIFFRQRSWQRRMSRSRDRNFNLY